MPGHAPRRPPVRHHPIAQHGSASGRRTRRTIRPIAMAYYVDATLVGAWCELRNDFRHFRVDRISKAQVLDERFSGEDGRLMAEWLALRKERPGTLDAHQAAK